MFNPPTYADVIVDEDGTQRSCDILYGDVNAMTRQALDYIFLIKPDDYNTYRSQPDQRSTNADAQS